jgi:copper homeostasis protein
MAQAAGCGVPVLAMIRPRAGDFVWSEPEVRQMEADIAAARNAGLAGVVLGASLPDGRLDSATLARLLQAARGMDCTLHRCFDLVPDLGQALETAISLGFRRILTSGGALRAIEGKAQIAALVAQARGRLSVMPGSGVTADNAPGLVALGVTELHASCAAPRPLAGLVVDLGFAPAIQRHTDAELVRVLKAAVH